MSGTGSPGPERTADGRHIVVDGRRWRATDPELPGELAAALRRELRRARSAIGRSREAEETARLRGRVQVAKEGLGERGTPWWELPVQQRIARAKDRLRELTDG